MRRGIAVLIIVSIIFCAPTFAYDWSTNPGNGSPENPYQISTPEHLMSIGSNPALLDKHFILMNDITFDPDNNPDHVFDRALIAPDIDDATTSFQGTPFSGTFDGANHEISYLTIVNTGTKDFIGLFGYINCENESMEAIKDLTLFGTYIDTESDYVGSLAGCLENGILQNCITKFSSFEGIETGLVFGNENVGGLVGYSQSGDIKNSSYSGDVFGADMVGGIVGWIYSGLIRNCTSSGNVYGFNMVGGIVGRSGTGKCTVTIEGGITAITLSPEEELGGNDIIIVESKTNAYVSGNFSCGGLVGIHSWGSISRCYSNATVRNIDNFGGGFAGCLLTCSTENCYANIDLKSKQDSGGFCGAFSRGSITNCYCAGTVDRYEGWMLPKAFIGFSWDPGAVESCYYNESLGLYLSELGTLLREEPMKQQVNFVGWDFVGEDANGQNEIWRMCTDGVDYPRLSWEFAQNGDFACDDGVDLADLEALAESWLLTEVANPTTLNYACDANGDEQINLEDFRVLSENWE